VPTLSYDLHVHPAPSVAPRWGDGTRVWRAAAAAGVHGFVWKSHEEHTVSRCRELPREPVRAIPSASLNPWAHFEDITLAIEDGALWLWGPTQTDSAEIGWELPLPRGWKQVAGWLAGLRRPLVLATGHLGADGRAAFAALAAGHEQLVCSITHSLYVPIDEALSLAARGCVFDLDAFTYVFELDGRTRADVRSHVRALSEAGALVYFTSDGGQASTGDPFAFGARVLDQIGELIGSGAAARLGIDNPAALVQRLKGAASS
jgi:Family of unknown function (DUF6282)